MFRKNLAGILFLIIGLVVLFGVLMWPVADIDQNDQTINIVATILPAGFVAQEIVQGIATVELLADPQQDPHSYAYTPDDLKALQSADLIVTLGVGDLELWMSNVLTIVDRDIPQIALSTELKLMDYADADEHADEIAENIVADPHVWLDPINMQAMAEKLVDELNVLYPEYAEQFQANLDSYKIKLTELDRDLQDQLIAYENEKFVAPHSAFAYFTRRYNLNEIGSVLVSPERTATPEEISILSQSILDNNIRVIYTEPETDSDFIESLARDLNLKIVVLDPLGTGKFEIGYYEKVMRQNVEVLINGFAK